MASCQLPSSQDQRALPLWAQRHFQSFDPVQFLRQQSPLQTPKEGTFGLTLCNICLEFEVTVFSIFAVNLDLKIASAARHTQHRSNGYSLLQAPVSVHCPGSSTSSAAERLQGAASTVRNDLTTRVNGAEAPWEALHRPGRVPTLVFQSLTSVCEVQWTPTFLRSLTERHKERNGP